MKQRHLLLACVYLLLVAGHISVQAAVTSKWNTPDSVYLLSYATAKNNNHNGLHFAWSHDSKNWTLIGQEYSFVKCDYGRWGTEKRMITPYLLQGPGGIWQCVWSLNERDRMFAHVASADLVYWGRQSYPAVTASSNCLQPVVQYNPETAVYDITYTTKEQQYYRCTTKDFTTYSNAVEVPAVAYHNNSISVALAGEQITGQLHRVAWTTVDKLLKTCVMQQYKNSLYAENTQQDAQRFAGLAAVTAQLTILPEQAKPVSDKLLGVFFEDINYAADGGLYAELVQNRDFEYALSDKEGRDKNWNSTYAWTWQGAQGSFIIDTASPLHIHNPHYAVLDISQPGGALLNTGFDGMPVKKGEQYNFSLWARQQAGKSSRLLVQLVHGSEILAQTTVTVPAGSWKKLSATLTATATAAEAQLKLQPLSTGRMALDMVSVFPVKTFKEQQNGLRADLAEAIAAIHPKFIRFPGGCVAHGDGLGNIYRWKNTIGPLEARVPQRNLWGYHQTAGLGYFEYFRFCEDIGAAPLPVLAAGVPCQNSGTGGGGQQGGIPMQDMNAYIQDIIDLVEYANGDVHTTWGKKRAEAGHPAPFNLQYIGIGNEDLISDVFEERFTMIYKALKEKHPEITVIGTVGPACEGTDYEEGWGIATKLKVPMVDEHYYQSPGWFIHNQDYYDKYDRSKSKVYLGEYAAHLPGRPNNLETALAEALYLTALERNGDVVSMASYAPLLAKEGHTQWNPNLIYFNNTAVKTTVGYEVQKLYGQNAGNEYLPAKISLSTNNEAAGKRVAVSLVRDTQSQDLILKMVNLLPVTVNVSADWNNIAAADAAVVKTVLKGQPADKAVPPVATNTTLAEALQQALPAYSFTVIRIRH